MSTAKKEPARSDVFVISLPEHLGGLTLEKYCLQLEKLQDESVIELDFSLTKTIDKSFYASIHKCKNSFQKKQRFFRSVNIESSLISQIKADAVFSVFNVYNSEHKTVDIANFISPFTMATENALKVLVGVSVTSKPAQVKDKQELQVDIAGVISLAGNGFVGSVSLCFPKETFLQICSKLFGESYTTINHEIEDAAAEMLNIIFGGAKAEININPSFQIGKAIPTIISGDNIRLKQTEGPTLILPFETELGPFHLEIEIV